MTGVGWIREIKWIELDYQAMLSPKMQRSVRVNENQLIMLSDKAQYDHSMVSAAVSRRNDEKKTKIAFEASSSCSLEKL